MSSKRRLRSFLCALALPLATSGCIGPADLLSRLAIIDQATAPFLFIAGFLNGLMGTN